MLCYFENSKNATEMQKYIFVQCKRRCCDWPNVSKVVCKISCWSGKTVEVDSDQIKTLIENNQHYMMREKADILKISKSIKLLVKMKNVTFISWKKLYKLFDQPRTGAQV